MVKHNDAHKVRFLDREKSIIRRRRGCGRGVGRRNENKEGSSSPDKDVKN